MGRRGDTGSQPVVKSNQIITDIIRAVLDIPLKKEKKTRLLGAYSVEIVHCTIDLDVKHVL